LKPCAIKGLLPFDYEDAEVFSHLQRDQELKECLQSIGDEQWRFGALSGESGVGKTSFLRAGLRPELEKMGFRCVYVKFSDVDPFESVKRACLKHLSFAGEATDGADFQGLLRTATAQDQTPIVLLFDQFEQFFVHRKRIKDREPFTQALAGWFAETQAPPIKILICVRSDFLDRLNELQKAMRYSLGAAQSFRLERFDPDRATEVFCHLAEKTELEYEREFISEMTRQELADPEEGLISPIDIQVLARMIERSPAQGDRAFNRKTLQKLGGAQLLPVVYLRAALKPLITRSSRRTAINVLSAMINLERGARAAALTFEELRQRLGDDMPGSSLKDVVECLLRGDLPLILPSQDNGEEKFELAHESLIPYLRLLGGKQLDEAESAYQLLDTYTNLWLGSGRASRYLFSWSRLRLIKRRGFFEASGERRLEKEEFLAASRRRFRLRAAAVGLVVLVLLSARIRWGSNAWQAQLIKIYLYSQGFRLNDTGAMADIAEALTYAGESHAALRVLDRIGDNYAKADALRRLAESCIRLGDKEKSRALLSDMTKMAERMNDDEKAYALEFITDYYIRLGDKAKAESLLSERIKMVENFGNDRFKADALYPITRSYVRLGDKEKALAELKEAIKILGQPGPGRPNAHTLGAMAEFYSEIGTTSQDLAQLEEAIKIAGQIRNDQVKAGALIKIVHSYASFGKTVKYSASLKEAIKAAEQIGDDSSKAKTLQAIASSYASLGDKAKARALSEAAIRTAERIRNGRYKAGVLEEMARSCARTGEAIKDGALLEEAVKISQRIKYDRNYRQYDDLKVIAQSYARIGETVKAGALLKKSIKTLIRNDDDWVEGPDFAKLVHAYARLGDKEKALAGLEDVIKMAERLDGQNKDRALGAIAQSYSELGEEMKDGALLKEAVKMADRINNDSFKANNLNAIAQSYARLGEGMKDGPLIEEAVKIAEGISNDMFKSDTLRAIARSYSEIGETVKALAMLEKVIKIENQDRKYFYDSQVYALSEAAESYARLGDNKKARALLEDAIRKVRWINGSQKAGALGAIVRSYARVAESSNDPALLYDTTLRLIQRPQPDSDRAQILGAMLSSKLAIADVGGLKLLTIYYDGEVEETRALAHILKACSHPELIEKNKAAAPSMRDGFPLARP
jgi:tetratricopeptide (TPR) repeat protein